MSSQIKSAYDPERQWVRVGALRHYDPPRVAITVEGDGGRAIGNVSRPDFLAAVAAECDAIVIPRTDLPQVKHFPDGRPFAETDRGYGDYTLDPKDTPERLRDHARALLALAEYLDAHPPVDAAQVEALTAVLYEATADPDDIEVPAVARRLVERGVRIEARP